jgi:hypothetical protein
MHKTVYLRVQVNEKNKIMETFSAFHIARKFSIKMNSKLRELYPLLTFQGMLSTVFQQVYINDHVHSDT